MLRHPQPLALALPPQQTPPALPGLVSSLRPVKRLSAQVADEVALLRRFSYKNKNQFKGCGWWRKLVEVDRCTARAVDEMRGWLGEFGLEGEKDEPPVVTREALCAGLLRLPRVALLVQKTLKVLLGCASILEQLIHSKAFLAFAVVVVSLVARLHALFTVVLEDLNRTSALLVKLAELNQLLPSLQKPLRSLPRDARRSLPLDPSGAPSSLPPAASTSTSALPSRAPSPLPPSTSIDDLGAVVSRSSFSAALAKAPLPAPAPLPQPAESALPSPLDKPKKKKRPLSSVSASASPAPPSLSHSPAPPSSFFPFDLDPSPAPCPPPPIAREGATKHVKRPRAAEHTGPKSATSGGGAKAREVEEKDKSEKKKKVKKRKSGGGDEIDAIFG